MRINHILRTVCQRFFARLICTCQAIPVPCNTLHAVLGVSGDDVDSHVKFIGDQQIPFQLLADEGNKVINVPLALVRCHAFVYFGS